MKSMTLKKTIALVVFASATLAQAQTVGNFSIKNTSFQELFNLEGRAAQPRNVPWAATYWPYGKDGIADSSEQQPSPAEKYDALFNQGKLASDWERENHSCKNLSKSLKEGCEGWWGHCNAWSAAAIKEPEPRKPIQFQNMEISVADQKAFLTEIWMESGSLFAGNTQKGTKTGNWIYDKNSKTGLMTDGWSNYYDSYWDVTPRAFFLIMTNYVGALKMGVVIDRFTGDEVWNQPIVGYRILPIRQADLLAPIEKNGKTIYPVFLRMKMFWANDEVYQNHLSSVFDIKKTTDEESLTPTWAGKDDYAARLVKFTLFFDQPVQVNPAGTQVLSAGRIVSEGIWDHQVHPAAEPNSTHPDFIWLPTQLYKASGNANPYLEAKKIYGMINQSGPSTGGGTGSGAGQQTSYVVSFAPKPGLMPGPSLYKMIRIAFDREGIAANAGPADAAPAGSGTRVKVSFKTNVPKDQATKILTEAGLTPLSIE